MQLINAIAKCAPRTVHTRYGERTVIDATTEAGESITIWRSADDRASRSIANGSRIAVGLDHKGKYSLLETPADRAQTAASRPMGFTVEKQPLTVQSDNNSRAGEIADYIERLGKLYGHCYQTATKQLESTPLATPEVKDVATTLFLQTVQHFGL